MRLVLAFVLMSVFSTSAFAQRTGPGRESPILHSVQELERKVDNLERQNELTTRDINALMWRVSELERSGRPVEKRFYCIAQCESNSSTSAGGEGRTETEAKQAAFDAVRKNWGCQMEIVECSSN